MERTAVISTEIQRNTITIGALFPLVVLNNALR